MDFRRPGQRPNQGPGRRGNRMEIDGGIAGICDDLATPSSASATSPAGNSRCAHRRNKPDGRMVNDHGHYEHSLLLSDYRAGEHRSWRAGAFAIETAPGVAWIGLCDYRDRSGCHRAHLFDFVSGLSHVQPVNVAEFAKRASTIMILMNGQPAQSPTRILFVVAGCLGMAVAGVVLYFFDPQTAGFYPVCALHQLTGLQCPGCGSLRALHQLSHGHIAAAWRFNPLLVTFLPLGLWVGLRQAVLWTFGWRWPGIVTRPIIGWALLVVTVVFGVARNLR
jgi:hypothetical protein